MSRVSLLKAFRVTAFVVLSIGGQSAFSNPTSSVSQFGITWFFSEPKLTGQFANGDWWVEGPVTITRITPEDTNSSDSIDMHGTMINPSIGIQNGWDSRIKFAPSPSGYNRALNVARSLPYTVPVNSSVCSVKSYDAYPTADNPQLETMAVLTVLPSAPAAGHFRPPFMGTNKALDWRESQLNYAALGSLPVVANTPDLATVASYFERPWVEKEDGWLGRYFHPGLNHPFQNRGTVGTYGREMAHTAADGLLSLQLNYTNAQKRVLLIRMVQAGIDIYGAARIGGYWGDGGGHNPGRKMILLLAGKVLNSQKILDYGDAAKNRVFQEDLQTFYVTAADVARVHLPVNNSPVQDYVASDIGLPEWGFNHRDQPQFDNKLWTALYREVVGPCVLGHILTARIMGLQSTWNNPAAFDYWDRWYGLSGSKVSTSTNSVQPFVSSMWKAYRGTSITPPPPVATFAVGDRISTVRNTNVRASGTLSGTLLGVQVTGSLGVIVAGPVTMDNITWWQVNYDSGADGWSGGDNFAASTAGPPGPTPPLPPTGVEVIGAD